MRIVENAGNVAIVENVADVANAASARNMASMAAISLEVCQKGICHVEVMGLCVSYAGIEHSAPIHETA